MHFKDEFKKVLEKNQISYKTKGIVTANKKIYPLSTDTKVLSSIFEMIIRPAIYEIALENKLKVREARAQNYYPDFTIMKNESDRRKIAIDVKTTYKKRKDGKVKFTLGSYTSFLRSENEDKNIEFPYSQYAEDWIVGFVYKRKSSEESPAHIYDIEDIDKIPTPFMDVSVFSAKKWRIAGDKAGSGNTTNIGSITGTLEEFQTESGIFKTKKEFLEYWRNYGRNANIRKDKFSNISEFRKWKKQ